MGFPVSVGVLKTLFHFDLPYFLIKVVFLPFGKHQVSLFLDLVPFIWALILLGFEQFQLLSGQSFGGSFGQEPVVLNIFGRDHWSG